jgi:hypothetical protein
MEIMLLFHPFFQRNSNYHFDTFALLLFSYHMLDNMACSDWLHDILNYNNLADHTIFLQGHPFDHMTHVNENNFNEVLATHEYKPVHESAWWGGVCPFRGGNLIYDYTPLCAATYRESFEGPAPDILFSPGAQWIAPKDHIRSKSLKFYEMIREQITPVRTHNADGVFNQWTLEGIWNYIFDPNVKEKPLA